MVGVSGNTATLWRQALGVEGPAGTEFIRPERGWVVRRPQPVTLDALHGPRPVPVVAPPPQPLSQPSPVEPRPPTRLSGAKLVDETWEKPRQEPPA